MASKLNKRRKYVLEVLSEVPISSTQQLAELAKVSTETMRKDLDALSDEGSIIKVHGGVALASAPDTEIPFDLRTTRNHKEKKLIANKAISLIQKDDIIVLESCTTNFEVAKGLTKNPELLETLIVITNSFSIVSAFDGGRKCKKIFFLGGWVNPVQYASLGHHTARMLQEFHVNKAFLSCAAIGSDFLITGYHEHDVEFQKIALKAAQKKILMADHSKFNKAAIFSITQLSNFDYLVTDNEFTDEELSYLNEHNIIYIKT